MYIGLRGDVMQKFSAQLDLPEDVAPMTKVRFGGVGFENCVT